MSLSEILHYLRLGGVTMIVLVLGSLLTLAVALERVITLWGVSDQSRQLAETIGRHVLRGELPAARTAAERSNAAIADVFLVGFDRLDRPGGAQPELLRSAVERERSQLGLRLRRNLWRLATIGSIAPFVGLFGTVA